MCGSNLCDTHIHTYRDIHAQSRHIHTQTKTNTPVIRARAAAKARAFVLVAALFLDFAARQNKRHIHISTYPQTHTDRKSIPNTPLIGAKAAATARELVLVAAPCLDFAARDPKKKHIHLSTHIYIYAQHTLCWSVSGCESKSTCPCRHAVP